MKLKYFIPFIGVYLIWNDIPHYEHERLVKPVQGEDALFAMVGVEFLPSEHFFFWH